MSSSSSEGEEENNAELMEIISSCETRLYKNPYLYEVHLEYVQALVKQGDSFEKIRQARQRFSQYFPLTEGLWEEWITDELSFVTTAAEAKAVLSLFERAVQDYLAPGLWLQYAEYAATLALEQPVEDPPEEWTPAFARGKYEEAVTAVGSHYSKADALWDSYLGFEKRVLSSTDEQEAQKQVVLKLFHRRLGIPLAGLERSKGEYEAWLAEASIEDPGVELPLELTMKRTQALAEIEPTLHNESPALLWEAYRAYIATEIKSGTPDRVQLAFERYINEHALNPDAWLEYVQYLDAALSGLADVVDRAYQRAVRNCPWVSALWIGYMAACERRGATYTDVKGVFEKALAAGFQSPTDYLELWMALCQYQMRCLRAEADAEAKEEFVTIWRETVDNATGYLHQYFQEQGDPGNRIPVYQARMEAKYLGDIDRARAIYQELTRTKVGNTASLWASFADFELSFGGVAGCRRVYREAVHTVSDYPEAICSAWVTFERDEGLLADIDAAEAAARKRLNLVDRRRSDKLAAKLAAEQKAREEKEERQAAKAARRAGKRKEKRGRGDEEGTSSDRLAALANSGEAPVTHTTKRAKLEPKSVPSAVSAEVQTQTLFAKNLAFTVTEADLSEAMAQFGNVKEVRIPRKPNGDSKGFAYVEFHSADAVKAALQKDRMPFHGRPLLMDPCVDHRKGESVKKAFKEHVDPTTLYISNMDFKAGEKDIEEMFAAYGSIQSLRLAKTPQGSSRGFCYVQYADAASAANALVACDNKLLKGRPLKVLLANVRRETAGAGPGGGGAAASAGPSKAPRASSGPMVPRAARAFGGGGRKRGRGGRGATGLAVSAARPPAVADSGTAAAPAAAGQPKSNADFRSMLGLQ